MTNPSVEKQIADKVAREHKIGGITIQAVGQIAQAAATEIQKAADEVDRAGAELSSSMRKLAEELTKHGEVAAGKLQTFVEMANTAKAKAGSLGDFIRAGGDPAKTPLDK